MRLRKTSIAAAVALGIGAAGLLTYQYWPSSDGQVRRLSHEQATLLPAVINAAVQADPAAETKVMQATPVGARKAETKAEAFERYAKGTAQQKFWAYTMTYECRSVDKYRADYGEKVYRMRREQDCGNLSPGQIASRMTQLKEAALAGVHDRNGSAWWRLHEEAHGVFGEPTTPDAETQALLAQAFEAAVASADPTALAAAVEIADRVDKDPAAALTYQVAMLRTLARDNGQPASPTVLMTNERVTKLVKQLPPEVAKQAIAAGEKLGEKS